MAMQMLEISDSRHTYTQLHVIPLLAKFEYSVTVNTSSPNNYAMNLNVLGCSSLVCPFVY